MVLAINWLHILENASKILGMIAAVIIAVGVIHTKVVAPWIAKPVAKAVKHELVDAVRDIIISDLIQENLQQALKETVEAIILSDFIQDQLKEVIEEHVSHEMRTVINILHEHDERLIRIENAAGFLVSKASQEK